MSHSKQLSAFPLSTWNGFPDGEFRFGFTRQQVEDTSKLAFYWVSDKLPGRRGSLNALTPEKGKLLRFKCAGMIDCGATVCTAQIAPGPNISRQLEAPCICGSLLRHRPCKVEWSVVFYRDGAIFENGGTHNHRKYTHSLPTPKTKKPLHLQEFVSKQPVVLQSFEPYLSEEDDLQADVEHVKSDADQLHSHDGRENGDADESGDEMNSEDEKVLDPSAEEDEDEP
ncbi:hypothetical protein B0H19DRAFT_1260619 [Mycena capillaripes]|nr:hypothetical protein B0H19DRAFT_1260619 [Mycena capillaripes]